MAIPAHISFEEFKKTLEDVFGQPLNEKASLAAADFWRHMSRIRNGIRTREISILVDMLFLTRQFPEYKRYHAWKGLAIVLIPVALVAFFFHWQFGVVAVLVSFGARTYGNRIKQSDASQFASELVNGITQSDSIVPIAKICAHYIAGTIALVSHRINVHWPLYPSCVLDGTKRFVETA